MSIARGQQWDDATAARLVCCGVGRHPRFKEASPDAGGGEGGRGVVEVCTWRGAGGEGIDVVVCGT